MATTSLIKNSPSEKSTLRGRAAGDWLENFPERHNHPGRARCPPRMIVARTKILSSGLFQEWGRVFKVGPMGVGLIIGVLAAGPIGPVELIPADKADITVGWNTGHIPNGFLEAPDAHLDDLLGIEGVRLAQLLDDGVHLWTRPAGGITGLVAFPNRLDVGRVPIVERAIQIRTRARS